MKKILKTAGPVLLMLFFCVQDTSAIPTFGTLMPEENQYMGGARFDLIFQRDVKDYDAAETDAYCYRISFGFADWFSLDGVVGLGDVRAALINEKKLRHPFNFSGGYGWRAKLYKNEKHGISWILGFQHVSTHPDEQSYRGIKREIIWDEWQFSTVLSKKIWIFTPYCGTKWSFIYLIRKEDGDRRRRLSNAPPMGLVVGTDVRVNDYLYLNAEGRFFDETAINAGFAIKY